MKVTKPSKSTSSKSNCWTKNDNSILPWKTFWMVGTDIKRFVERLKLSVQISKEEVSWYLNNGTSGGNTNIAIGNSSCELFFKITGSEGSFP